MITEGKTVPWFSQEIISFNDGVVQGSWRLLNIIESPSRAFSAF